MPDLYIWCITHSAHRLFVPTDAFNFILMNTRKFVSFLLFSLHFNRNESNFRMNRKEKKMISNRYTLFFFYSAVLHSTSIARSRIFFYSCFGTLLNRSLCALLQKKKITFLLSLEKAMNWNCSVASCREAWIWIRYKRCCTKTIIYRPRLHTFLIIIFFTFEIVVNLSLSFHHTKQTTHSNEVTKKRHDSYRNTNSHSVQPMETALWWVRRDFFSEFFIQLKNAHIAVIIDF